MLFFNANYIFTYYNLDYFLLQVLLEIDENCDIAYTATAAVAGGLIDCRDFVDIRLWATKDDITLSAGKAVLHPSKPHQKKLVR